MGTQERRGSAAPPRRAGRAGGSAGPRRPGMARSAVERASCAARSACGEITHRDLGPASEAIVDLGPYGPEAARLADRLTRRAGLPCARPPGHCLADHRRSLVAVFGLPEDGDRRAMGTRSGAE